MTSGEFFIVSIAFSFVKFRLMFWSVQSSSMPEAGLGYIGLFSAKLNVSAADGKREIPGQYKTPGDRTKSPEGVF